MLTPDKIEKYRKRLEIERARLWHELQRLEKPENFGHDVDDFSEGQEEAEALSADLAAAQALKDRVNEIDSALNKIRTGNYGVCENCKRPVSEKELEIVPETRLCENCKK
jgi:RNA polymerase-binding transcription factor DksA